MRHADAARRGEADWPRITNVPGRHASDGMAAWSRVLVLRCAEPMRGMGSRVVVQPSPKSPRNGGGFGVSSSAAHSGCGRVRHVWSEDIGDAPSTFAAVPLFGCRAVRTRQRGRLPNARVGKPARAHAQCAIASTSSSLVRGPSVATDTITIAMHTATNANTPVAPKSRRKNAMKNGVRMPLSRLQE